MGTGRGQQGDDHLLQPQRRCGDHPCRIVPESVKPLVLADSDKVRVGDEVFVIGAPMNYAHSLTVGHVSARRVPEDLFGGIDPVELLQTDAAINEGNSGGPMFNMDGEVIGVVSHILSKSGGSQGLGFVVTSNMARLEMLEKKPFWSGMDGFQLNESWAAIFNLPQAAGFSSRASRPGRPRTESVFIPDRSGPRSKVGSSSSAVMSSSASRASRWARRTSAPKSKQAVNETRRR